MRSRSAAPPPRACHDRPEYPAAACLATVIIGRWPSAVRNRTGKRTTRLARIRLAQLAGMANCPLALMPATAFERIIEASPR